MDQRLKIFLVCSVVGATMGASIHVLPAAESMDSPGQAEITRSLHIMGTVLDITVTSSDRAMAIRASQSAIEAVESAEHRLSTWRDDSELAAVNATPPGQWAPISARLFEDLSGALYWWDATNGSFDPGIGSLVKLWDLRGRGRVPAPMEIETARVGSRAAFLDLNESKARRNHGDLILEEGAFGKGAALRDAAEAALDAGAVCVVSSFGGQVDIRGECGNRTVSLAHPEDRSEIAVLRLNQGSVATSGNSERAVVVDGVPVGHVLDPRSGHPAPDWGSVTVITDDPLSADCVATALYVMGPDKGARWLDKFPQIQVVFARNCAEGVVRLSATPGLRSAIDAGARSVEWLAQGPARPEPREHGPPPTIDG